jgi:hypothetical protein
LLLQILVIGPGNDVALSSRDGRDKNMGDGDVMWSDIGYHPLAPIGDDEMAEG